MFIYCCISYFYNDEDLTHLIISYAHVLICNFLVIHLTSSHTWCIKWQLHLRYPTISMEIQPTLPRITTSYAKVTSRVHGDKYVHWLMEDVGNVNCPYRISWMMEVLHMFMKVIRVWKYRVHQTVSKDVVAMGVVTHCWILLISYALLLCTYLIFIYASYFPTYVSIALSPLCFLSRPLAPSCTTRRNLNPTSPGKCKFRSGIN